jgi:hypothetical protein
VDFICQPSGNAAGIRGIRGKRVFLAVEPDLDMKFEFQQNLLESQQRSAA